MNLINKFLFSISRGILTRNFGPEAADAILAAGQEDEREAALSPAVVEVERHSRLAAVTFVPVIPRRGMLALRAVITVKEGDPLKRVLLAHERAHLKTGTPIRVSGWAMLLPPPGEMRWYGLSPAATARVEEATNRVAIQELKDEPEMAAVAVALQESYWRVEGAVEWARTHKRQVLGAAISKGVGAAMRKALVKGDKFAREKSEAMAAELGLERHLKAARKRVIKSAKR